MERAGYRLHAAIGRGGTGTVYHATQVSLARDVALKVLAADLATDDAIRERFVQESTLAASLDHPHILPIHDAGQIDGIYYIAMRYVAGSDLQALISAERRLPAPVAVGIVEQLASALDAAHAVGLIHRDVKPGNVLVDRGGPAATAPHVWLGDFGLSKRLDTTLSPTERPLGTVHYMAPEQIRGQRLDPRADIYSLGCLLYQCLTGRVPFERESEIAVLYAHLEAAAPRVTEHVPELPAALDAVVGSALAKSPDERPASALDLAAAASVALTGKASLRRTVDDRPATPRRTRSRRGVVGRLAESEQLASALDDANSGEGGVVLLTGEPGIGKTTIARGLSELAQQRGVPAVWGVGLSAEAAPPYWHWLQVIRGIAGWPDAREVFGSVGRQAAWLRMIVPDLQVGRRWLDRKGVKEGRFHLYEALLALLTAAAERSGVLIVLDDLHAADEASLLALSFVASSIADKRILILAAQRDVAFSPSARTIPELSELVRPTRSLSLQGLAPEDVACLISLRNNVSPSPATVQRIHHVTAGNPLFVTELLPLLGPEQLEGELASVSSGLPLPAGIRDAITARLAPLSARGREVLELASVIGERFRSTTLARAGAIDPTELLELLDQTVGLRLVRPLRDHADGYAFHHGLIQATIYDALPKAKRAKLHRAVAEALLAGFDMPAGEGLAEVAHHFLEAAVVGDHERAVDYARRAGDWAMTTFAYEQAVGLYARAEALCRHDVAKPIALLQSLGEAQTRAGDTDGARRTLKSVAELAMANDDPAALARATLALGIWGLTAGVDDELVQLAEIAVERLQSGDDSGLLARAKGFLAAALHWSDQLERRRLLADEALALARSEHERLRNRESTETLVYVLGRYLLARWGPDSGRDDFETSNELLGLSEELGDSELELLTRNWRISVLLELGRFATVDQEIARVERMATELRQPRAMVFMPLQRALRAAGAGRFAEAERRNAESAQIAGRVHGTVGELAGAAQILLLRLMQGRLAELEPLMRAMVSAHPEMVAFRSGLAASLVQAGRPDEARAELERLTARGLAGFPKDSTHIVMLALTGGVAADLADAARAGQIYSWLEPYNGRWVVSPGAFALWPVDRSLGRLATVAGEYETALGYIAEARKQSQSARALPCVALTALDEARALAARGQPEDRARIAGLAREARELGQEIGMGAAVDEATLLESQFSDGAAAKPSEVTS